MSVSPSQIMVALNHYIASPAGKQAIKNMALNGEIVFRSDQEAEEAAEVLERALSSAAGSCGLPSSVMSHIDSASHSVPVINKEDGSGHITISLGGDLSRPSLDPSRYYGIDNIVALFNSGYSARDYVFGEWHGKETQSLLQRPGLHFMEAAVNDFNSGYGPAHNATARLVGDY